MDDQDFVAEMLVSPTGGAPKATDKGTVRLDLYENVKANRTVCVYDFKTGEAGLSFARASSFAEYIYRRYPGTRRINIGQVKPAT